MAGHAPPYYSIENGEKMERVLKNIKFDSNGLIVTIAQDAQTGEVLQCAYMNEESLRRTLAEGRCWYWSRSRGKLWLKGETSGHFQTVKEIRVDCDGDALVLKVEQKGAACHKGYFSCFFRKIEKSGLVIDKEKTFDIKQVYKDTNG